MIITYHGAGMVKVSHGDWVAVFSPIGGESKLKPNRFGADLALVPLNDPWYNGVAELIFGERQPFVINSPGEYERLGTFIHGLATAGPAGKINTIYSLVVDGKNLVHLGALIDAELPPPVKEELAAVDILFVPLAGPAAGGLTPRAAYQLALALNPHLIIPVNYTPETLKQLIKEAGAEGVAPGDKLVIKDKDLIAKEAELAVLTAV
ncbi:MAG TPA: MBL fold metallo-hydrolase [Candidatus Paceibacterota bacterium]